MVSSRISIELALIKTFPSRPKNRTLTWKLNSNNLPFGKSKVRKYVEEAFNDWAVHAGLTFREAPEHAKADFNLAFVDNEHGDGAPFDGPGLTLAHAFLPWDSQRRGEAHFDLTEPWSDT